MKLQQFLNNNKKVLASLLIISLLIYIEWSGNNEALNYKRTILEDSAFAIGTVTTIKSRYKQGYEVTFEFPFEGIKRGGLTSSSEYGS